LTSSRLLQINNIGVIAYLMRQEIKILASENN